MKRAALLLSALALAAPASAETWVIDRAHSETGFQVRHLMSKVRGRFNDFSGTVTADPSKPEQAQVEFTVKAASIDTDNESRDKHLRSADFFDAEKYPDITFKSTKVVAKGDNKFEVSGPLTMRGVTKEVTIPVTLLGIMKGGGGRPTAGFEAAITLNRKDFGILWNRALDAGGMLLSDEVWVTVNIEATPPKAASN